MTTEESNPVLRKKRRWFHPLVLFKWLLLLVAVAYLGVGLYFYCIQNDLIYEGAITPIPLKEATRQAATVGLVPWEHTTPGATGPQGYVEPNFADPAPRGTIVFFHGNGESAWLWKDQIAPFTRRGFRVFLYEYPGYGGRPGPPGEKAIVPDARAVIRSLAEAGYGPLYVWGVSLGAGVTPTICADPTLPVQGLTLVAPWDNIADVGSSYYPFLPIRPFMSDTYDSIAGLKHFQHPICVIYGDQDDTIYPQLTLNLYANLPEPKKIMLMKGYGHCDWPDDPALAWWDEAINFIAPPAQK
jgi:pimeloyl-ACP methyl ester carboxylesterase